ncbi:uncharacterized protein EI90DRAFT_3031983 [Cantharellus anzutake]|uniref:uncharacterized protein n=1 Tax=Cantharellus anzutake TaxID=1750568 RepID=UPI001907CCBE|nr:uncharacterized protein EI90DRAFT_3031983 [Cantharellus anzutake]KAF8342057.1 hypothetical protein EI90DRAFT_3031983 [Cantharellus anzutake]
MDDNRPSSSVPTVAQSSDISPHNCVAEVSDGVQSAKAEDLERLVSSLLVTVKSDCMIDDSEWDHLSGMITDFLRPLETLPSTDPEFDATVKCVLDLAQRTFERSPMMKALAPSQQADAHLAPKVSAEPTQATGSSTMDDDAIQEVINDDHPLETQIPKEPVWEVEAVAQDALEQITKTISHLIAVSGRGSKSLKHRFLKQIRSKSSVIEAVTSAIRLLREMRCAIQSLYSLAVIQTEGQMANTFISQIRDAQEAVGNLFDVVQASQASPSTSDACAAFQALASLWLSNYHTSSNTQLRGQCQDLTLPSDECELLSSPLARAIQDTTSTIDVTRRFPLSEFLRWAKSEAFIVHGESNKFGFIRSIACYRVMKWPLYHEFALVCFHSDDGGRSWVKVERAARIKNTRLQRDSFGPLFGGVDLRETVTISGDPERLTRNSKEIASIHFDHGAHPFDLPELGNQIEVTSDLYPVYKLWSANCRYFARRLVQTAQDWSDAQQMHQHHFRWDSSAPSMQLALCGERFGGSLVVKSELGHKVVSLQNLAGRLAADGHGEEGLRVCEDILALIQESVEESSETYRVGIFVTRTVMACCHYTLCHWQTSLECFQDVLDTPELNLKNSSFILTIMAGCYSELGDHDKAITTAVKAFETIQAQYKIDHSITTFTGLFAPLCLLTELQVESPSPPTSVLGPAAELVIRACALHTARPVLGRYLLSEALTAFFRALSYIGGSEYAVCACRLALDVTRDRHGTRDYGQSRHLVQCFYNLGCCLGKTDQLEEALDMLKTSRDLCKELIQRYVAHPADYFLLAKIEYECARTSERFPGGLEAAFEDLNSAILTIQTILSNELWLCDKALIQAVEFQWTLFRWTRVYKGGEGMMAALLKVEELCRSISRSPGNQHQRSLFGALSLRAKTLIDEAGDKDTIVAVLTECVSIGRLLATSVSSDAFHIQDLIIPLFHLAKFSDVSETKALCDEAFDILSKLEPSCKLDDQRMLQQCVRSYFDVLYDVDGRKDLLDAHHHFSGIWLPQMVSLKQITADFYINRAFMALRADQPVEAQSCCRLALASILNDPEGNESHMAVQYEKIGMIHFKLGRMWEAIEMLRSSVWLSCQASITDDSFRATLAADNTVSAGGLMLIELNVLNTVSKRVRALIQIAKTSRYCTNVQRLEELFFLSTVIYGKDADAITPVLSSALEALRLDEQ